MSNERAKSVAIIGAGVSGLSTARMLLAEGMSCTVFERADRLGGVWSVGYANFGTQVQRELYEFPDYPLPSDAPDFTPGPVVREYLESYARDFGVWDHIRLATSVEAVRRPEGSERGWIVTSVSATMGRREQYFDVVVSAVGLFSHRPHVPRLPGLDEYRGEVMHVSEFQSPAQLAGKRVAVVGYGKSATDVATEAAAVAAQTTIVFREAHWPVPAKLLGILPFKWAMLSRLTSTLIPAYYRPSRAERVAHTVGRPLIWFWWRLVELLLIAQCRLDSRFGTRPSLIPKKPVEVDTFGEAVMLPRPEFYRRVRNGGIEPVQGLLAAYHPDGLVLGSGERLDADVIVMATGWRTDYSFFSDDVVANVGMEKDGLYLHRHIASPGVPDLYFVGGASTISNILTYSLQACWLAELLTGRMSLPSSEAMNREIAEVRDWKRAWMPESAARGSRLLLHMHHYHDQLLSDIGADPRRKKGALAPFKEVFAPYQPSDYRDIVSGAWREGKAA